MLKKVPYQDNPPRYDYKLTAKGRDLWLVVAALRDHPDPHARIGESWEFSTLPGSESRVGDRPLAAALGRPLPFLAKLIDTALPLSVQVHPGDDPTTGAPGKEEAWVVLAADPDARVWAGLAPTCSPAEFRRAVAAGEPLLHLLRTIPVVAGSVLLIPARTVHAIGGGILLAEIQQPSDCTFRFHDHGSERPIQPREALAAVDLDQQAFVPRMLGMPRRIYTYDAGQGWETFNMMSTMGAFLLAPATLVFIYNFFKSKTGPPSDTRSSLNSLMNSSSVNSSRPSSNVNAIMPRKFSNASGR